MASEQVPNAALMVGDVISDSSGVYLIVEKSIDADGTLRYVTRGACDELSWIPDKFDDPESLVIARDVQFER